MKRQEPKDLLNDETTPFWVLTVVCVIILAAFALIARAGLLPQGW